MDDGVNFGLLARGVGSVDVQELRRNPAFKLLCTVIRNRFDAVNAEMFNGKPADPIRQGAGVAYRQLLKLIEQPVDDMLQQLKQESSK